MAEKDVIESNIGALGIWQVIVVIAVYAVKFSIAWHQLSTIILAPPAKFTCKDPSKDKCAPDCEEHVFDKSVFTRTIIMDFDLVCGRKWLSDLSQTIVMLGILVGNTVFGWFADRYGRRKPLVAAVFIQVVSGIAVAFSRHLWLFMLMRFILATATGGTMLTSFVLLMEIIGVRWRTLIGTIFQVPFNLGHATLGMIGYLIRDWTYVQLALSLPSILLLSYWCIIPESPRWLLSVGREEEAYAVMQTAAKMNRLPDVERPEKKEEEAGESSDKGREVQKKKGGRIIDLFRTKIMALRTIYICFNWFAIGFGFFGVAQYIGQIDGNLFVNVTISGLVQVPGTVLSVCLMNRLGRKYSLMVSYVIAALSFVLITIYHSSTSWLVSSAACFAMFGYAMSFAIIYVFSGELFPTVLRNIAIGIASMSCRFGSMSAPYVATLNLKNSTWVRPLMFTIVPTLAFISCCPLPETLGCILPDTVEEAEKLRKNRQTAE